MTVLEEAIGAARSMGHDPVPDPPHELSSVVRYMCRTCGRGVIVNNGHAYGSALSVRCSGKKAGSDRG